MPARTLSPDRNKARFVLDSTWSEVLSSPPQDTDREIDRLINSDVVAIRFCLPTQLLGKIVDPKLDCLCLTLGKTKDETRWAPRPFATATIVPWISTIQNVLGTSTDPYVSNPLRRSRLQADPGEGTRARDKSDWELLHKVLSDVQDRDNPSFTQRCFLQTLRSIRKRFDASNFEFVIPERVSIEQVDHIVREFLLHGSGGDRGLAVAAALFETFGKQFSIYDQVRRFAINASDASTGQTADIECLVEGEIRLAIEVKERDLTLIDIKSGMRKARKAEIKELLFNAPGTATAFRDDVDSLIEKTWGSGTNLYRLSIHELISVGLVLAGEEGRRDFLINVGYQLNTFNTQPANRLRWRELLEAI